MQLMGKEVDSVAMNLESNYKKPAKFWQKKISASNSERKVGLKWDGIELMEEFNY